jgi:hypothetical protein
VHTLRNVTAHGEAAAEGQPCLGLWRNPSLQAEQHSSALERDAPGHQHSLMGDAQAAHP